MRGIGQLGRQSRRQSGQPGAYDDKMQPLILLGFITSPAGSMGCHGCASRLIGCLFASSPSIEVPGRESCRYRLFSVTCQSRSSELYCRLWLI